jgi:hypothetical protein
VAIFLVVIVYEIRWCWWEYLRIRWCAVVIVSQGLRDRREKRRIVRNLTAGYRFMISWINQGYVKFQICVRLSIGCCISNWSDDMIIRSWNTVYPASGWGRRKFDDGEETGLRHTFAPGSWSRVVPGINLENLLLLDDGKEHDVRVANVYGFE